MIWGRRRSAASRGTAEQQAKLFEKFTIGRCYDRSALRRHWARPCHHPQARAHDGWRRGHGGYLAPDWTADWLHREAIALLAILSADGRFANETAEQKDALRKAALSAEMRKNTYDPASGVITVSDNRARAIEQVEKHFTALYKGSGDDALPLSVANTPSPPKPS
jgi:hypothetical protein